MNRPHVQEDGPVEGSQSIQTLHPPRAGPLLVPVAWAGKQAAGQGEAGVYGGGTGVYQWAHLLLTGRAAHKTLGSFES